MKLLRLLLIAAGTALAVLVVAAAVALTPSFQTWLVHRQLAQRPGLHLTIGHIAATPGRVMAFDVAYERNGVTLRAPRIDADLPVWSALFSRQVLISQLRASGWTLDAAKADPAKPAQPNATAESISAAAAQPADGAKRAATAFSGVLPDIELPFDLAVDRVELSGDIRLPAVATTRVTLSGGGLAVDREAKFDLTADATLPGAHVNAVRAKGQLSVAMDSPRTFSRIAATLAATAAGGQPVEPVALNLDFSVTRGAAGEKYAVTVAKPDRPLLQIDAELPSPGRQLAGKWKLDIHDSDVARFALGHPLPGFAAVGEGTVDSDVSFSAVHVVGRIDAAVSKLDVFGAKLAGIGAIRAAADLDAWQRGDVLSVSKLTVDVDAPTAGASGDQRRVVARVRALQAFDFNPKTGDLHATNPANDLVGISLQGVPLAWAKPFFQTVELSGTDVRGECVATPRAGGFTAHTISPLSVGRLSVARIGHPVVRDLNVSLSAAGDYTPQGWQAEISGMTAKTGQSTVLLLDAKAGQLAGPGQALKATGLLTVDVASLAAQPVIAGAIPLQHGEAAVEFAGSFGATKQVQAKISLAHLAANPSVTSESLPDIAATVRADVAENGHVAINLPVTLQREGRKSDFTFIGSFAAPHFGDNFEAQVSSQHLVVEDAKPLLTLWRPASQATTPGAAAAQPPWAGLNGKVALQLKEVVYPGGIDVNNIVGELRISGGTLDFGNVHATVGEGGDALLNGRIGYDAKHNRYAAQGHLVLVDFNPAPVFRAHSTRLPIVDGKFGLSSDVTATSENLESLATAAVGNFELTSRRGTFRALNVDVGNLVENSGKLRAWLAAAGNSIGNTIAGWTGRKEDYDEITSRSQAANELAKSLSAIAYDQLAILATRDEALNATVKQFALISPEFRITGHGRATHVAGQPLRNDEIALDLELRARGRAADLMKYLGVLDSKPDDLGYSACTIPIKVTGTVANLDAREFSNRLIALAVEKSGILERAGARALDWINRLRGKG